MAEGPDEMDLYVLRHGLAEDRNYQKYPDDRERPLTRKGMARLARQVKGMNSLKITPEVVVSSPLTRAMQTAEIVLDGLAATCRLEVSDALAPSAYPQDIIDELARTRSSLASVMVVGHEPHLSSLVSLVSSGSPDAAIRLRKGGLCKLRIPILGTGRSGRIEWSITPRQMTRLV